MIKMVALDLDNTLLNSNKEISTTNEAELKKLQKKGVRVVLCTGRPINAIWNYIEQLGLNIDDNYTITFNGALVVKNTDRHVLFKRSLSKNNFVPLYDFAKEQGFPLDILDFEQVYPIGDLKKSEYQKMLNGSIEFHTTDFAELPDIDYSKAVMAAEPAVLDKALSLLPEDVKKDYHIVRSQPKILEFLSPKVDKAYGLGALLSYYGMDFSNLMAFGDAENDAGMLKKAKVGVAMKNAQPEIKKSADDVTDTNDNDGVAKFLEEYFK